MHKEWMTIAITLGALAPALATAQPAFFDDFDGPDLLPHWERPNPSHWEYDVSGGMLHVRDLLFPIVTMEAHFEPLGDFRLDAWMGWELEPAAQHDELLVSVENASGETMAQFGLSHLDGTPRFLAWVPGHGGSARTPPSPGLHQFTIERTGSRFEFHLNGEYFGSVTPGEVAPVSTVSFFLRKPFPGDMNPKHIDRVVVVPAPAGVALAAACAFVWTRRRHP